MTPSKFLVYLSLDLTYHLPHCQQKRYLSIFCFMTFKIIFVLFLSTNNYQVSPFRKVDMRNKKNLSSGESQKIWGRPSAILSLPFVLTLG